MNTVYSIIIQIYDPYDREYTRGQVHINNEESYVVVIHNPKPTGLWRVVTSAEGPYSLRVTGVSKLDFGVKFATVPTTAYENSNWQPVQENVKNQETYRMSFSENFALTHNISIS
jgi:hypothetical protein